MSNQQQKEIEELKQRVDMLETQIKHITLILVVLDIITMAILISVAILF